jgi:hypothetical protein
MIRLNTRAKTISLSKKSRRIRIIRNCGAIKLKVDVTPTGIFDDTFDNSFE